MITNHKSHKEIRFILMVFILIALLMIGSKINSLYQIGEMKKITNDIFEYPFKISNATLAMKSEIYKIHRDMKDIVLSESNEELQESIKDVDRHEQHVYAYLTIIKAGMSDEEGKKLEHQTRELFAQWKPFRDETIELIKNHKRTDAIARTKGNGAHLVLQLENSTLNLYLYAQNKANNYKRYSDSMHMKFINVSILMGAGLLLLLFLIAYYTLSRITNYILKTAHLTEVISVIRAVNQLIVREKSRHKLVQDICNVLVTNRVYGNAWIALYNDSRRIEYVTSGDNSEKFTQLKHKLEGGWIPPCIQNIDDQKDGHLLIESTKRSCPECPFTDLYESKGAFSIQLKFNEKVFGNLTLSVNTAYLKDEEEISLLHEVAGDISYALYNLEIEEHLSEHESSLLYVKELYGNIINSVDNILFVKDTNFIYTVCNQAFEKFVGKSNQEIVGKSDYEIFDKSLADFFRSYDEKMFLEKKASSNFEWVTYPDGSKVYLYTVKSPVIDSTGNIVGLVGNSADFTEQKRAEDALFESQKNYKLLADNGIDLIWKMDIELQFTYVNPSVKTLFGYSEEEFIGTKLYQHCTPEMFEKARVLISKMLSTNNDEGASLEMIMHKKDGSEIPLEINGKIIFDETHTPIGFQGSARDFTVQTEARNKLNDALNALEKKSQELQTILKEAPNPIMLHNEAGEVLMVNKVWESLTGYSYPEINTLEKWTKKACHKKSLLKEKNTEELYSIQEKINLGENVITSKEGNEMIWQVSSAPLGMINGKRTIVTSATDITELKKKDELMMAQSRHAAMGEMIGMIAHQWRQPIAGIAMDANNMLMDIAFETFDNTAGAEYAQDILDQTNHLSKTIDDFRNFFKPDKSVSAVKVEDIIEETLAIVKESLTNNSIAIETSYLSNSVVNAYPRELMQVFVNIINNAKDSLISSHPPNAHIDIKIYDDEDYVNSEICDNGGGIDTAILPKVFDPYFSTKDEKTGTGLGLYMSKMIIEEHLHGCIEASNNKDGGACFKVRLLKKYNSTSEHQTGEEN